MSLIGAYAVPHPPLIVPAVGKGEERAIDTTIQNFTEVAKRVAQHQPDLIIITSPHAPLYRDGFFIADAAQEEGSMARFNAPEERLTIQGDPAFAHHLEEQLHRHSIAVTHRDPDHTIDHGSYVPLYFLAQTLDLSTVPVLRIGLSGLPAQDHRFLGQAIAEVARSTDRRVVLIASGDWSHKLTPDGPYGFAPAGPVFDDTLVEIFSKGSLSELFTIDETLCTEAAECGLRSFQIMAGALEESPFEAELLSYEGPFGVGYGIAAFEVEPLPEDPISQQSTQESCDPLVALARTTVETYVRTGAVVDIPTPLPSTLDTEPAGVFVSLHEKGELRGCIGTISARRETLSEEIITNAICACSRDPRFRPVTPEELPYLSYSVDVLGKPEAIFSLEQLDPKHYGVIVERHGRSGLLLPDLEGVDTVADQLAIAKAKAGIRPAEDVSVKRFEVVRHTKGGEAAFRD